MDDQAAFQFDENNTQTDAARNPLRKRLGRGLNALLGGGAEHDFSTEVSADTPAVAAVPGPPPSNEVAVELIERNPYQPRKDFDKEALQELSESLKTHGVLQPLLVRPHNGRYQLIAGERRWLAAQQAGLETVPCRVMELEDKAVCEVAIVENVQRKDLSDLEKAQAFQEYLDQFGGSVSDLAKQLGMNRTTVTNFIRLLSLSEPAKKALSAGKISGGHARAILSLDEQQQSEFCTRIQQENLSVRKTEDAVKQLQQPAENTDTTRAENAADESHESPATIPLPGVNDNTTSENASSDNTDAAADAGPVKSNHLVSIEEQLREALGLRVEIKLSKENAGKILLSFDNNDDFDRIVKALRKGSQPSENTAHAA